MQQNDEKIHEARFLSLILSLYNSAWIALGKVANPMTGKAARDLDAARGTIDLLHTLKFKTKGNRTKEEEKILENCLTTLHLNYVEESAKPEPAAGGKDGSGEVGRKAEEEAGKKDSKTGGAA